MRWRDVGDGFVRDDDSKRFAKLSSDRTPVMIKCEAPGCKADATERVPLVSEPFMSDVRFVCGTHCQGGRAKL